MSLPRPPWVKNLKKQIPDQITVLNKSSYMPMSTGNGRDGKPQVAMPVNRMLHENEIVLNSATSDALGGKEGVHRMVMSELSKKGMDKMPMPKESTIRQAAVNNMAGKVVGSMPEMRRMAGYVTGNVNDPFEVKTTTQVAPAEMPTMKVSNPVAPTMPTQTADDGMAATRARMQQTYEPQNTTPVQTTQSAPVAMPEIKTTTPAYSDITKQASLTWTPTQKQAFDKAYNTFDPEGGYLNAEAAGMAAVNQTGMIDAAQAERMKNPAYAQAFNSFDPQGAYRSAHEAGMAAISGKAPAMPTTNDFLRNTGFASMEEAAAARKLGITNKKDYDAELAARSAPAPTTGTTSGARMPDARGMNTFRQQYDYAAQQADARSAVADQALAMRMAQNPNLTQGAQNTMLQEQMMAKGAQQSKLAGDAAQAAFGIQREQNAQAMNAMLAAGDVDGYAQMFQQEFGVPINKDAMKSAVNQKALSTGMEQLNTYLAQFGNADASDPVVQSTLRGVWAATGNTGEMDQGWATRFLENTKNSQNPYYQAMQSIPENTARDIWGNDFLDKYTDAKTGKTGYAGFQSALARDIMTGFIKINPATGNIEVNDNSFLFSLGDTDGTGGKLTVVSGSSTPGATPTNGTPAAPTITYSAMTKGATIKDSANNEWQVGGTVGTGANERKVIYNPTTKEWANVDASGNISKYTSTASETGVQIFDGEIFYNGKPVTENADTAYTAYAEGAGTNPDPKIIDQLIKAGSKKALEAAKAGLADGSMTMTPELLTRLTKEATAANKTYGTASTRTDKGNITYIDAPSDLTGSVIVGGRTYYVKGSTGGQRIEVPSTDPVQYLYPRSVIDQDGNSTTLYVRAR